jgi:carbon storage regulator
MEIRSPWKSFHSHSIQNLMASLPFKTIRFSAAAMIGDHIVLKVIRVNGDKARLGIEAPRELSVHREGIADRIQPPEGRANGASDG